MAFSGKHKWRFPGISLDLKQLMDENLMSESRARLCQKANCCRIHYLSLQERIARYKVLVTNRTVAEILGVPKGSVDSGLFYLRAQDRSKVQGDRSA